jgi:hypothetical protein
MTIPDGTVLGSNSAELVDGLEDDRSAAGVE